MNFLRPYVATIKDSFREALASRVLWIMLVLITTLLIGLSPIGIHREMTWKLGRHDLLDASQLAARLTSAAAASNPSPGRHVWAQLPPKVQQQLEQVARPDAPQELKFRLRRDLTAALNERLEQPDFFDRQSWTGVGIDQEARDLVDRGPGRLSKAERARMNRLLLEAAFPDLIRTSGATSVQLSYMIWKSPLVPFTEQQFGQTIDIALGTFMEVLVGWIGVFVAILVTASIIPQTLEPGSIELLLSKPISRTLLFLSKFLGGCAFILVNAAYLICGLWLIVGLRLDVWNHQLLLCIPIFLCRFAIYYSVSALAGIVWRSAIVSVVVTILFWGACLVVGQTKGIAEAFLIQPERIRGIVQAGQTLVIVNEFGQASRWDSSGRDWAPIFQPGDEDGPPPPSIFLMPQIALGPVYQPEKDRLVATGTGGPRGRGFNVGTTLWLADRANDFRRVDGVSMPTGATHLLVEPEGTVIAVSPRGISRIVGDGTSGQGLLNVFGLEVPNPLAEKPLVPAGPDPPLAILAPSAVALNDRNGELAVLTRGNLVLLTRGADGLYRRRVERALEGGNQPSLMAYGGNTILLAHEDGVVQVVNAADLAVLGRLQPAGTNSARFLDVSSTGRWFAMVFHNGRLHLYDRKEQRLERRSFTGQGDISAATFVDDTTLLVADRTNRVTAYDVANNRQTNRWSPKMGLLEWSYRYVVVPAYTVFPKPGELDRTVHYLLTGKETVGLESFNMQAAQDKLNPWAPVWSSAAFMLVVLAAACVYLWRADL